MKNLCLLGAICTCLLLSYLPTSSYASFVVNPGPQPGGEVIPVLDTIGSTEVNVVFVGPILPITIEFDSLGQPEDYLVIRDIVNNTGTPWTSIDFTFVNSTVLTLIPITPKTGLVDGVFYDGGPILVPGVTTSVTFTFDPAFPEVDGLINFEGLIEIGAGAAAFEAASIGAGDYSLIITPSAIPIPAAVWLFSSGLIGLVGIARRKKA